MLTLGRLAPALLLAATLLAPSTLAVYTGPYCGTTLSGSCPGSAYEGSSFVGVTCLNYADSVDDSTQTDNVATVAECAYLCRFSVVMGYGQRPDTANVCFCGSSFVTSTALDCSDTNARYAAYAHTVLQASAGVAKRGRVALKRKIAEEATLLCPRGRTACRILGSDDGYECLDTMTELESCGGCRYGTFSPPAAPALDQRPLGVFGRRAAQPALDPSPPVAVAAADDPVGVDCSDRTLFQRGLTCTRGKCVSYA